MRHTMAMIRSGYSMISGKEPDTKATELSNNPAIKIGDAPFGLRTGSPFCSFKDKTKNHNDTGTFKHISYFCIMFNTRVNIRV